VNPYALSLHLFRSDIRLADNTALIAALEKSEKVIPVYIFDEIITSEWSFGSNSINFLINSLQELDSELKSFGSFLYLFEGSTVDILNRLLTYLNIDSIFVNRDYSPHYLNQDDSISVLCRNKK
jgi:deoxyribodipyrimidine photo-lyase